MSVKNDYLSREYKGVNINVYYDEDAENPFENWDVLLPTMVYSGGRYGRVTDYSDGDINNYLANRLSYGQVQLHQKKIVAMMEADWILEGEYSNFDQKYDTIIDELSEWLTAPENCGKFCKEFKIPHYYETSRGYSQSDWADVFVCWTPEYGENSGLNERDLSPDSYKEAFDLWSYWAWGEVFTVECDEVDEYCGGHYGEKDCNDAIKEVEKMIDEKIKEDIEKYISKSKDLSKNKVSHNIKKNLLDEFKKSLIAPAQKLI